MRKLLIFIAILMSACGISTPSADDTLCSQHLPAGFSIVEQGNDGSFIRISSPQRASSAAIDELAATFGSKFDRIDLCFDTATDRGDEYLAIIDSKVYDYENNRIYSLNPISK